VALVISVLTGRALEWVHAIWERNGPEVQSYERFTQLFRAVFDHPTEGREGGERLLRLCQGSRTASEYSLYFQKVAVSNGWNDQALLTVFCSGLQANVQTELACRDENLMLDKLFTMAISLESSCLPVIPGIRVSPRNLRDTEPMEVGTMHLPPEELKCRRQQGLCSYCGESDHPTPVPGGKPSEEAKGRGVLLHLPR
jgi:hypothetical protein